MKHYSNFVELEKGFSRFYANLRTPVLPALSEYSISMPQSIDDTRIRLEQYLRQLVSLPDAITCPALESFLDLSPLALKAENLKLTSQVNEFFFFLES